MSTKSNLLKFALVSCVFILTACGATGPAYVAEPEIVGGSDKALVYIYRPSAFQGGAISYDVHVGPQEDDKTIVTLKNGGYFPYYSAPGEVEFWAKTEAASSLTLDLQPGDVKYIKGTVKMGLMVGRPDLIEVTEKQGKKDLPSTKRLEK